MPFGKVLLAAIPLLFPQTVGPAVIHGTANAAKSASHNSAVVKTLVPRGLTLGKANLNAETDSELIYCFNTQTNYTRFVDPSVGSRTAPTDRFGVILPDDAQNAINACLSEAGIQPGVQGAIKDRKTSLSGPVEDVYRTLSVGSQSPIISGNPNNRSISIVADVFKDARGQKVVNYRVSKEPEEIRKISENPNGTKTLEAVATRPVPGKDAIAFRQMKVTVETVSENTPLDQIKAKGVLQVHDAVTTGNNQPWPWKKAAKHNNASTAQGGFNGRKTGVLTSVG